MTNDAPTCIEQEIAAARVQVIRDICHALSRRAARIKYAPGAAQTRQTYAEIIEWLQVRVTTVECQCAMESLCARTGFNGPRDRCTWPDVVGLSAGSPTEGTP